MPLCVLCGKAQALHQSERLCWAISREHFLFITSSGARTELDTAAIKDVSLDGDTPLLHVAGSARTLGALTAQQVTLKLPLAGFEHPILRPGTPQAFVDVVRAHLSDQATGASPAHEPSTSAQVPAAPRNGAAPPAPGRGTPGARAGSQRPTHNYAPAGAAVKMLTGPIADPQVAAFLQAPVVEEGTYGAFYRIVFVDCRQVPGGFIQYGWRAFVLPAAGGEPVLSFNLEASAFGPSFLGLHDADKHLNYGQTDAHLGFDAFKLKALEHLGEVLLLPSA